METQPQGTEKPQADGVHFSVTVKTLKIVGIVVVVLLLLMAFVVFVLPGLSGTPSPSPETTPPGGVDTTPSAATISVITISNPACSNCFDITNLTQSFRAQFGELSEQALTHDSSEAVALIEQYSITRLPAAFLTGDLSNYPEITEQWEPGLGTIEDDGTLIFRPPFPVYFDLETQTEVGLVEMITLVDPSCTLCNPGISAQDFAQLPVPIITSSVRTVSIETVEGQELFSKYAIRKLPTVILSEDVFGYPSVSNLLEIGTQEEDGLLVIREVLPYYFDFDLNRVVGAVNVISLVDATCSECIAPDLISDGLSNFLGLQFDEQTTVDINSVEGQALIEKYEITGIPAVLFNGDMAFYFLVEESWDQIGEITQDNNYLFTTYALMGEGIYKDPTTGELIDIATLPVPQ